MPPGLEAQFIKTSLKQPTYLIFLVPGLGRKQFSDFDRENAEVIGVPRAAKRQGISHTTDS